MLSVARQVLSARELCRVGVERTEDTDASPRGQGLRTCEQQPRAAAFSDICHEKLEVCVRVWL